MDLEAPAPIIAKEFIALNTAVRQVNGTLVKIGGNLSCICCCLLLLVLVLFYRLRPLP